MAVSVSVPTTRLGGLGMWANQDPTRWEKPAPFIPNHCPPAKFVPVLGISLVVNQTTLQLGMDWMNSRVFDLRSLEKTRKE